LASRERKERFFLFEKELEFEDELSKEELSTLTSFYKAIDDGFKGKADRV
jgi:hypothetical protein